MTSSTKGDLAYPVSDPVILLPPLSFGVTVAAWAYDGFIAAGIVAVGSVVIMAVAYAIDRRYV